MATPTASLTIGTDLTTAVFVGDYLPAHDEVFDAAEVIAMSLRTLHAYITQARSPEQADEALAEMGRAIATATAIKGA